MRSLNELTDLENGGTGARCRPRHRVGWLEVPRGRPVAISALVAAAVVAAAIVVREGGSGRGQVWLAVHDAFRCLGSQVCHPFHVLDLCCVWEQARQPEFSG